MVSALPIQAPPGGIRASRPRAAFAFRARAHASDRRPAMARAPALSPPSTGCRGPPRSEVELEPDTGRPSIPRSARRARRYGRRPAASRPAGPGPVAAARRRATAVQAVPARIARRQRPGEPARPPAGGTRPFRPRLRPDARPGAAPARDHPRPGGRPARGTASGRAASARRGLPPGPPRRRTAAHRRNRRSPTTGGAPEPRPAAPDRALRYSADAPAPPGGPDAQPAPPARPPRRARSERAPRYADEMRRARTRRGPARRPGRPGPRRWHEGSATRTPHRARARRCRGADWRAVRRGRATGPRSQPAGGAHTRTVTVTIGRIEVKMPAA